MKLVTGATFGLLVSTLSLGAGSSDKIVGGSPVPNDQEDQKRFSTVALTTDLEVDGKPSTLANGKSFCSGTILTPRVVVTAAHCLQRIEGRSGKGDLLLGEAKNYLISFDTNVSADGDYIRAEAVIPHPDWDPAATLSPAPATAPNDIGLVILSEDIPDYMQPAIVADVSLNLSGLTAELAGYGVTRSRNNNDTGVLRQVDTPINSADSRSQRFTVGALGRGACGGDSGGPAFVNIDGELQLIGATSTGIEIFGRCLGIQNNYTDVRYYADWIESQIN